MVLLTVSSYIAPKLPEVSGMNAVASRELKLKKKMQKEDTAKHTQFL